MSIWPYRQEDISLSLLAGCYMPWAGEYMRAYILFAWRQLQRAFIIWTELYILTWHIHFPLPPFPPYSQQSEPPPPPPPSPKERDICYRRRTERDISSPSSPLLWKRYIELIASAFLLLSFPPPSPISIYINFPTLFPLLPEKLMRRRCYDIEKLETYTWALPPEFMIHIYETYSIWWHELHIYHGTERQCILSCRQENMEIYIHEHFPSTSRVPCCIFQPPPHTWAVSEHLLSLTAEMVYMTWASLQRSMTYTYTHTCHAYTYIYMIGRDEAKKTYKATMLFSLSIYGENIQIQEDTTQPPPSSWEFSSW